MLLVSAALAAYTPKRLLLLHDQECDYLADLLGGIEVPVDKVAMDKRSFVMPELFSEGAPVYSHVVIYGDKSQLTKDDLEKLARFADGSDDPMYSRLSHHERETLPNLTTYQNNASTRRFKTFFDPYPGASIMLITTNETFRLLLTKIGASVVEGASHDAVAVHESPILVNLNEYKQQLSQIDSGLFVQPAFKNQRTPFSQLVGKGNASLIAAWRGVKNSARIVFVGNVQIVQAINADGAQNKALGIKLMYDLINWFGMNTQVVRVNEFSHRVLNLSDDSPCKQNLHLSYVTGDHVREGNLVLIELSIDELSKNGWSPLKPLKQYRSFKEMTEAVGFVQLENKNFQSVMKKQTKSFNENYDLCMKEVLGSYTYTELQVFESFVQDWFVVNLVQDTKTKKFFALLEPDLVRSYTLQIDFDRDTTNRINLIERVHAYVDRHEEHKFFLGNSVWQFSLVTVIALSVFAVLFLLVDKPETEAEAAKKHE